MLVPARAPGSPPRGLDPVHAAPLTDAALTPYHAVRRSWPKLTPGSTAVAIGVGGLGHLGVQILGHDSRQDHRCGQPRDRSRPCQRSAPISCSTSGEERLRRFAMPPTASALMSFSTSSALTALSPLLRGVAQPGRHLHRRPGRRSPAVSFFGVPYEASVQTTYWGNRFELVEVLDLAARGLIRAEITRFNLDWSAVAYAQLAKGTIDGRAVVVPNERYRS